VSKSTPTLIVTPRVLLGEGIASFLQSTPYKVVAIAAEPRELPPDCCPKGQQALAIVGVDRQNGDDLDDAAESIRLLRTLMPDGKVVLVVETNRPIDLQRVLVLAPDACIFNLGSRDTLIKVLELASTDQRVFVFDKSIATITKSDDEFTDRSLPLDSFRLGIGAQATLSSRECEILFYLAGGQSNKAIARLCKISEATVKVHLKAILRKTKTQNRTQAAIWAIEHGFRNHSSEHKGSRVADAPTLSPAGAISTVEYPDGSGANSASRDDGLPPQPPSARHPGSDRSHGR
jgi:two-component system, NarL family, nitrate/nitrite response regulator NarL